MVANDSQGDFNLFAWLDTPVSCVDQVESQPHTVGDSELFLGKVGQKSDNGMSDKSMLNQQEIFDPAATANEPKIDSEPFAVAAGKVGQAGAATGAKKARPKKNNKKPCQKCNHLNGNRSHKCKQCGHKFIIKNEGMKSTNKAKHDRWLAENSHKPKRKRGRSGVSTKTKKRKVETKKHTAHMLGSVVNQLSSAPKLTRQIHTPFVPASVSRQSSLDLGVMNNLPSVSRQSSMDPGDMEIPPPMSRMSSFNADISPMDSFQFDDELFDFAPVDGESPFIFGESSITFDQCFDHANVPEITV